MARTRRTPVKFDSNFCGQVIEKAESRLMISVL
jgi:hypothetical protein